MKRSLKIAVILMLVLGGRGVSYGKIQAPALQQLVAASDLIIVGTVQKIGQDQDNEYPFVLIEKIMLGKSDAAGVEVQLPKKFLSSLMEEDVRLPRYKMNERVLLFLKKSSSGTYFEPAWGGVFHRYIVKDSEASVFPYSWKEPSKRMPLKELIEEINSINSQHKWFKEKHSNGY